MAGDQLSISGKSVWHNTGTPAQYISIPSTLSTFLNFFAGTPAVVAGGHGLVTGASLDAATAAASALSTMLSSTPAQSANTTYAPKAAINWILFDDQFKVVANGIGTDLVSSDPDVVKTHSLFISGIPPMAKNGYVYVYCSNESNIDVYFDNLQVVLTHGPILEETHYYPSGLTMAGISDKAWGKQANNFHFQGKEMQNREFSDGKGLEEYDFNTRYYDQQLGRWHSQDPAGQYASPYVGMGNSWPNGKDPNGQWFGWDDVIVSAVGFAIGYVGYGLEKGNWGGKALLSGAAGLAIAEGGYLTLGGGLAASSAAGVGGSGSIGAASSFAFSYGASDAGSLFSNKDQIHNSSDWGAFGLIAGYSLVSSISAGMSSENTGNAVDKFLEIKPDAMPGIEAVSLSEKGAAAAGYGGFISSVGNQVLQSYDPSSNSWSLHWGRIFGKAIFEGYGASYIGKVVESSFYIDDFDKYIPDSWQLGSNSSLLNWLYTKMPSAAGSLVSKGISAGFDALIPKW
jgi:RHS repeat-associated protein